MLVTLLLVRKIAVKDSVPTSTVPYLLVIPVYINVMPWFLQVQYSSSLGKSFYAEYLSCLDSLFLLETKNEATVSRYLRTYKWLEKGCVSG